jgi:hypothetical protein
MRIGKHTLKYYDVSVRLDGVELADFEWVDPDTGEVMVVTVAQGMKTRELRRGRVEVILK